jgi:hypothetical protein
VVVRYFTPDGAVVHMEDLVHPLGERWIVAEYDDASSQWTHLVNRRRDPKAPVRLRARSLKGLAKLDVRTYAHRSAAVRAARRIYGLSPEETVTTRPRSIRMSDEDWAELGERAEARGLDRTAFIRLLLSDLAA